MFSTLASIDQIVPDSAPLRDQLLSSGVNIDFDLPFFAQMIIFSVLILVLRPLLFEPVLRIFEEREKRTDGARAEARTMQEKAGELLTKYEAELERVRVVAGAQRDEMRAEAAKVEAAILTEAREAAAKIVEDGRATIQEEVQSIHFDLKRKNDELARVIATRLLGRELS